MKILLLIMCFISFSSYGAWSELDGLENSQLLEIMSTEAVAGESINHSHLNKKFSAVKSYFPNIAIVKETWAGSSHGSFGGGYSLVDINAIEGNSTRVTLAGSSVFLIKAGQYLIEGVVATNRGAGNAQIYFKENDSLNDSSQYLLKSMTCTTSSTGNNQVCHIKGIVNFATDTLCKILRYSDEAGGDFDVNQNDVDDYEEFSQIKIQFLPNIE